MNSSAKQPLVSIVVTTKNEERCISHCLESIKGQSYDNVEIIVVDNNSADRTCEIARQYTDQVYNHGPERSAQRNYGMIERASGEFAMYMDADMTLAPDLINEAVAAFNVEDPPVALFVPLRWENNNWINKLRGFEREFYDGTVLDAVRIIKRNIFCQSGGFDVTLNACEDWDVDRKVRALGKVATINSVMTHHEDPDFRLRDLMSKVSYYTPCLDRYRARYGYDDSEVRKQFGIGYRFFRVFVEDGKWRKVVRHPLIFSGMFALKIVMGVCYVFARNRGYQAICS